MRWVSVATVVGDRGFRATAGLGGFAAGWFDLGFLTWTSGANDGGRAEIARHTVEGRGLGPYSPVHLRGTPQSGGAILLTWIRRTRAAAGDSWVLAEAPLGEEREEYELEILDGATVVRSVATLTSSSFAGHIGG